MNQGDFCYYGAVCVLTLSFSQLNCFAITSQIKLIGKIENTCICTICDCHQIDFFYFSEVTYNHVIFRYIHLKILLQVFDDHQCFSEDITCLRLIPTTCKLVMIHVIVKWIEIENWLQKLPFQSNTFHGRPRSIVPSFFICDIKCFDCNR